MKRMWTDEEVRAESSAVTKQLVEGGTLNNAKPIYIHPVFISKAATLSITIFIFNNDPTPFATFKDVTDFIKNMAVSIEDTSRFPASGTYYDGSNVDSVSLLYSTDGTAVNAYITSPANVITGVRIDTLDQVFVYDGVNKLN